MPVAQHPYLRAPHPWFGGKSGAAEIFWSRVGDVSNLVDPFCGSLALLLGRPHVPRSEIVNDVDCYLANFWRCFTNPPREGTRPTPAWREAARFADWPVNEADLHARHLWLVNQHEFRERMKTDPFYCDPLIAGWWVWGQCAWIGGGWCSLNGSRRGYTSKPRPHLSAH